MSTVRVRGEGGAVWVMALPLEPNIAKRVESGDIEVLEDEGPPKRRSRAKAEDGDA